MTRFGIFLLLPLLLTAQGRPVVFVGATTNGALTPTTVISGLEVVNGTGPRSATQSLLAFSTDGTTPPVVQVSEKPDFSTLIPDVSPALFANADLATKAGSLHNNTNWSYVIGKRTTDLALDGAYYSRALKAATQYYARVYPQGNVLAAATTSFTTGTIPFGLAYLEGPQTDPARPGISPFPTLPWNDRTISFAAPLTGLELHRMTLPQDSGEVHNNNGLSVIAAPAGWSFGRKSPGSVAKSQANSTAKLFLGGANNPHSGNNYLQYDNSSSYSGGVGSPSYFASFQINLSAAVNAGGSAPNVSTNAQLSACMTQDGASCYPGSKILDSQPLGTTLGPVRFAGGNTAAIGDMWQSTLGTSPPPYTAQAIVYGTANCNNTTTVTTNDNFPYWIGAGSNIKIGASTYFLADSSNTNKTANLTSVCPTGSYGFSAANFGILVWKKNPSNDLISIDAANTNNAMGYYSSGFDEGGVKACSQATVSDPVNGHPLVICRADYNEKFHSIDTITGQSHFLFKGTGVSGAPIHGQYFDSANPAIGYGLGAGAQNGGLFTVYKVQYFGDYREPTALGINSGLGGFAFGFDNDRPDRLRGCFGNTASAVPGDPCLEFTSLTGNLDIQTLATNFTANPAYAPQYDAAKFGELNLLDIDQNRNMFIMARVSGQNYSIAWSLIFNPTATNNAESIAAGVNDCTNVAAGKYGCVGGGKPGAIVAADPSWARTGSRWHPFKDGIMAGGHWINVSGYPWQYSPGRGPYGMQVIDGAADGSSNTLDGGSSLRACPANNYNIAVGVVECSQVTVSSEPYPYAGSNTCLYSCAPGEIGNSALGDRVSITQATYQVNEGGQREQIIAKRAGSAAGTLVLTLWRDVTRDNRPPYGVAKTYSVTATLPMLIMTGNPSGIYAGNYIESGTRWSWDYAGDPHAMNAAGKTILPDRNANGGHSGQDARGDYVTIGTGSGWGGASSPLIPGVHGLDQYNDYAYRSGKGKTFDQVLAGTAFYQKGASLMAGNSNVTLYEQQSHPGVYAPNDPTQITDDFDGMYLDGREYRGGGSSGNTGGSGGPELYPQQPATFVSGSLWDFAPNQLTMQMPYSKFYPVAGSTGDRVMVDISSPAKGDVLGSGPADNYKFCRAAVAGECRANSVANHVYVNAPHIDPGMAGCFISRQDLTFTFAREICVGAITPSANAFTQAIGDRTPTPLGAIYRQLLRVPWRTASAFMNPVMTADNRWGLLEFQLPPSGEAKELLLARMPPRGAVGGTIGVPDSVDRSNFIPQAITVPQRANSTAYVRAGTAENNTHGQTGDAAFLNCTGRQELCATANTSTWAPDENWSTREPFIMELTEALATADTLHGYTPSTLVPVDVSGTGTTIYLAGIPAHMMYYQIVYKDRTSGVLTLMPLSVVPIP